MTVNASARLAAAFADKATRTALIPYVMAGDPGPDATVPVMHALVAAGADVIELGVPFSDPMADGPVIQAAAERALAGGTSLRDVLGMVAEFRRTDTRTPVVLMGYANPIERMGAEAFARAAGEAGVDGVLTVDYPPEEVADFARLLGEAGIDPIFLLAPTSTDARIVAVAEVARGYVYYVSLKGVTGAGHLDAADVARNIARIRQHVQLPVGVGFGIRDAASAVALAEHADAVVIGSRLVDTIAQAAAAAGESDRAKASARAAEDWLRTIRQALDAASTTTA
ncbi:tryptophan synthase subunit alpha [Verticiella alkaliphila]|uniref:tryptophan synthase subunit alpha n=1 Tax=Verticiella alkaliphila TaxID=2779529 RepID=UPI00209AAF1E|nr:tryptophan synthase subunit alpha [Verticiella sp. GG226]